MEGRGRRAVAGREGEREWLAPPKGPLLVSSRTLRAEPLSVGKARTLVARFGPAVGGEAISAARVAMSELVTNVVRHSPGNEVRVRVTLSRSTLRVEVADDGRESFRPMESTIDAGNGRGLPLVEALSDRCGTEWRPTTLAWFEIDRPIAA